jgi:hypothetical protein
MLLRGCAACGCASPVVGLDCQPSYRCLRCTCGPSCRGQIPQRAICRPWGFASVETLFSREPSVGPAYEAPPCLLPSRTVFETEQLFFAYLIVNHATETGHVLDLFSPAMMAGTLALAPRKLPLLNLKRTAGGCDRLYRAYHRMLVINFNGSAPWVVRARLTSSAVGRLSWRTLTGLLSVRARFAPLPTLQGGDALIYGLPGPLSAFGSSCFIYFLLINAHSEIEVYKSPYMAQCELRFQQGGELVRPFISVLFGFGVESIGPRGTTRLIR